MAPTPTKPTMASVNVMRTAKRSRLNRRRRGRSPRVRRFGSLRRLAAACCAGSRSAGSARPRLGAAAALPAAPLLALEALAVDALAAAFGAALLVAALGDAALGEAGLADPLAAFVAGAPCVLVPDDRVADPLAEALAPEAERLASDPAASVRLVCRASARSGSADEARRGAAAEGSLACLERSDGAESSPKRGVTRALSDLLRPEASAPRGFASFMTAYSQLLTVGDSVADAG